MGDLFTLKEMTIDTPMSSGSDPVRTFLHALQLLLSKDMEGFIRMYADDAVMEYPFAPEGWPKQLVGHSELWGHMHDYPDHLRIKRFKDITIHETRDPEVIVTELIAEGVVVPTGQPYEVRYIEVITIRGGRFVHYRDYWNPMLALQLAPKGLGNG